MAAIAAALAIVSVLGQLLANEELLAQQKSSDQWALRLHLGEIFLEIGIVFASLAILTKRASIWLGSLLSAGLGIAIALTTLTITG